MLSYFICPDNGRIDTNQCLHHCRLPQRCLTRATLAVIANHSHEWDGTPHVTQLLNGTMQSFLHIERAYATHPKSMAFALLGSSHHALLQTADESRYANGVETRTEIPLNIGWMQGTADLLETYPDGQVILTDHKTWGSFRVGRALGLSKQGNKWSVSRRDADLKDVTLQINAYRLMLEQQHGVVATHLQVQVTVRDGGLAVASQRGITDTMYLIPIDLLPDEEVQRFFGYKAARLLAALAGSEPDHCTPEETWNGNRCKSYCDVAEFCPQTSVGRVLESL